MNKRRYAGQSQDITITWDGAWEEDWEANEKKYTFTDTLYLTLKDFLARRFPDVKNYTDAAEKGLFNICNQLELKSSLMGDEEVYFSNITIRVSFDDIDGARAFTDITLIDLGD